MNFQIILADKNPELIEAWQQQFVDAENVTVRGGNILLARADALVSPANSFGFMDGGLDWSISELFEHKIQGAVQEVIRSKHAGELLVGAAEIVSTGNSQFPFLVCAPTMRVPQNVSTSVNAFLAMRAILLAVEKFNQGASQSIKSVVVPGLCTGAGKMTYEVSALQMREAYDLVSGKKSNKYLSLDGAISDEKKYKKL